MEIDRNSEGFRGDGGRKGYVASFREYEFRIQSFENGSGLEKPPCDIERLDCGLPRKIPAEFSGFDSEELNGFVFSDLLFEGIGLPDPIERSVAVFRKGFLQRNERKDVAAGASSEEYDGLFGGFSHARDCIAIAPVVEFRENRRRLSSQTVVSEHVRKRRS